MSGGSAARLGLAAVLVALAISSAEAQSSSPGYRLSQSTVNGGGETSISPTGTAYRLTGSFGQESAIGTSSSFGYVLQSGFWGFVGSGLVPVLLTAKKNVADPARIELSWTGNNPPYGVYETVGCTDVTSGQIAITFALSYVDPAPYAGSLVCYSVFATAPGPIAPGPTATSSIAPGPLAR